MIWNKKTYNLQLWLHLLTHTQHEQTLKEENYTGKLKYLGIFRTLTLK